MIITRDQLGEIFRKLDTNQNQVIDEAEFEAGYRQVNAEATAEAINAKWLTISKDGPVTLDVLAHYWGIKLGTDDVDTEGMNDEQIIEVMALRGVIISLEEERKRKLEEAEAVKSAEAMLAKASLGRRMSRRGSREGMPGGIAGRELTRRDSKVIQMRSLSNVLQSEQSAEVSFLQAADVGEHAAVLAYVQVRGCLGAAAAGAGVAVWAATAGAVCAWESQVESSSAGSGQGCSQGASTRCIGEDARAHAGSRGRRLCLWRPSLLCAPASRPGQEGAPCTCTRSSRRHPPSTPRPARAPRRAAT